MAELPVSQHIRDLLVAGGTPVGDSDPAQPWAVYVSREPVAPDSVITVYDTPGTAPNPKYLLDFPGIQVRIRGEKELYIDAWNKARDVKDLLLGFGSGDVGDDRIDSITLVGDINHIGYDDNERPLLTLNFNLIFEPQATVLTNRVSL